MKDFPDELKEIIRNVRNKRARVVLDHIIENGFITTEQLEKKYGYNHPPRAARDVRELGIPLETYKVKSSDGRNIAAYKFGDLSKIDNKNKKGRRNFSKKLKNDLFAKYEGTCAVCNTHLEIRYFQIDHKVPFEVSGDDYEVENINDFLLLCASCNRAKSWSCEHCHNWNNEKDEEICKKCYWADPKEYEHIALINERRLSLVWQGDEIENYSSLIKIASEKDVSIFDLMKEIIENYIKN